MRLLGIVLLIVAVVVGLLAASTAYLVSLDRPADELAGLTLSADAGEGTTKTKVREPALRKGAALTPESVERLRGQGVSYVRVREFDLGRWPGRWAFAAAIISLVAGAGLLRTASRRALVSAEGTEARELPEQALQAIKATVQDLVRDLPGLRTEQERLRAILDRLGAVQKTHMPAFVEARTVLVARMGLGGYAELMDRYAAAERQIYRAWSAAADGVYAEALGCLETASVYLDEALTHLTSTA
jgi:hypothetical protein